MSNITNQNIPRSAPYVAPGAPTSPLILAVAGWLVALAVWVSSKAGIDLPVGDETTTAVAAALAGLVGLVQHHLARREQAAGVAVLDETIAEALAELPPSPEAISESVERIRARAAGRPGLAIPPPAMPDPQAPAIRALSAAEQLHLLDPVAPPGLDRWSGVALRRILEGEIAGVEGPISWGPSEWPAELEVRVSIDGVPRYAALDDHEAVARALGAERWLEARKNASADAPLPRPRIHSNALLGEDGEPVSAGDLDDPDPDERPAPEVAG